MAVVTVDGTNYDLTNGLVSNANEFTFQNLADASVTWADWDSWDGFGLPTGISIGTTLTFNTEAVDLGAKKNVLPSVTAITNSSTAHTISFLISDDDSSYSAASAGPLNARYIKTKIVVTNTSARPGFTSLETDFTEDQISEIIEDVAVTHDTADEFNIPITKSYGKILGITLVEHTGTRMAILTDSSNTTPQMKVVDLDTWGKVSADTTVSVIVYGLPNVTTESNGNISTST